MFTAGPFRTSNATTEISPFCSSLTLHTRAHTHTHTHTHTHPVLLSCMAMLPLWLISSSAILPITPSISHWPIRQPSYERPVLVSIKCEFRTHRATAILDVACHRTERHLCSPGLNIFTWISSLAVLWEKQRF